MNPLVPTYLSVLLIFYALLAALLPAPIALHVRVTNRRPPAHAVAEVRIPRHVDNRAGCVRVEGPKMTEGCWTMAGENEPALFPRPLIDLPGGEYIAQARLWRAQQTIDSNVVRFTILGE